MNQPGHRQPNPARGDGSGTVIPAPWSLGGVGYLFLYRFQRKWLMRHGAIPEHLASQFAGGLGALMLVDYRWGDADPYRELLFMPGKFRWGAIERHGITEIVVSTRQSVESGRANWAIPKRLARIEWSETGPRRERIEVIEHGETGFSADLVHWPLPLPMHTALLPMPLAQPNGEELLLTDYSGRGVAWPARLELLQTEEANLPPLEELRPLAGFRVAPFRLRFPVAKRRRLDRPSPPLWSTK
jgi:hypothetical protein